MIEVVPMTFHPLFALFIVAIVSKGLAAVAVHFIRSIPESKKILIAGLFSIAAMTWVVSDHLWKRLTWEQTVAVVRHSEQLCAHNRNNYERCGIAQSRLEDAWLVEIEFRDINSAWRSAKLILNERDIDLNKVQDLLTPGKMLRIAYARRNPEKVPDTVQGLHSETKLFAIGYACIGLLILVFSAGSSARRKDEEAAGILPATRENTTAELKSQVWGIAALALCIGSVYPFAFWLGAITLKSGDLVIVEANVNGCAYVSKGTVYVLCDDAASSAQAGRYASRSPARDVSNGYRARFPADKSGKHIEVFLENSYAPPTSKPGDRISVRYRGKEWYRPGSVRATLWITSVLFLGMWTWAVLLMRKIRQLKKVEQANAAK